MFYEKMKNVFVCSLKECFEGVEMPSFSSIDDFFTAVYGILMSHYVGEEDIFIEKIYDTHDNIKRDILKININSKESALQLLEKISKKSPVISSSAPSHLHFTLILLDKRRRDDEIFSLIGKEGELLKERLIVIIDKNNLENR